MVPLSPVSAYEPRIRKGAQGMSEHTCPQCGAFFLEAILSIDPVPIMETDKMLQPLGGKDCVTGERIEVVHIDDCRRIELEKLELSREISNLKARIKELKDKP